MADTSSRMRSRSTGPVRGYLRTLNGPVADQAPPGRRRSGTSVTTSVVRAALRRRTSRR
jgi:hypothetical protein